MSQTSVIFGALLIAFIVFITLRGELGTYIALGLGNIGAIQAGSTSTGFGAGLTGTTPTAF